MTDAPYPAIPPRPLADDPEADARERLIRTAYELFRAHGLTAVGVDRVVAEASVAKTTLYRHFRTKDALIVATIGRHAELWTRGWLEPEVRRRGDSSDERLLVIFDVLDDWFRERGYEGCYFMNCLLETHDGSSPVVEACLDGIGEVYDLVLDLAQGAAAADAEALALGIHLLMRAAFVAAREGNGAAVGEARRVAALLVAGAAR